MSERTILLGYEMGTGDPVRIPVHHMAVTGITQQSGKTTTLEALIGRSGLSAVTFVTKRGESAFQHANRIPPYFREHCDWQFVSSVLEAYLGERVKAERAAIMRACSGAKSLKDVDVNIREALRFSEKGDEKIYFMLSEYFAGLLPEIDALMPAAAEGAPRPESTGGLKLLPGINCMDLSAYSTAMQGLVIASVMEWIAEYGNNIITLIPEAWELIPREHGSPCTTAAIRLARKGACCGNFLWVDSQDLASINIEVRKMFSVYLLGVQRERNEVRRTIEHIPEDKRRPKAAEVMQLDKGWFYASFGRELHCVYVQPAWLDANPERARKFASEPLPKSYVAPPKSKPAKLKEAVR